jgi:hypothetical protein
MQVVVVVVVLLLLLGPQPYVPQTSFPACTHLPGDATLLQPAS